MGVADTGKQQEDTGKGKPVPVPVPVLVPMADTGNVGEMVVVGMPQEHVVVVVVDMPQDIGVVGMADLGVDIHKGMGLKNHIYP